MKTLTAAIALAVGLVGTASADVYIGAARPGDPLTLLASDPTTSVFAGQFGPTWNLQVATVTNIVRVLDSTLISILGTAPEELIIEVSTTGNVVGGSDFKSAFTVNDLPVGWTMTLESYVDDGDVAFAHTSQIGNAPFAAIGTDIDLASSGLVSGTFSATGVYHIVKTTLGIDSAEATMRVSQVDVPERIGFLGAILAGAGLALRRRRNT